VSLEIGGAGTSPPAATGGVLMSGTRVRGALAALVALMGVIVVAGCTGGSSHTDDLTSGPAAVPSRFAVSDSGVNGTRVRTHYGEDAAVIASRVPGCLDVLRGPPGGAVGVSSFVSCRMSGYLVAWYTWRSKAAQDAHVPALRSSLKYWASGTGWTAFLAEQGTRGIARSIASAAAKALGGRVES
jgi:hypothetical protein